jgi:hypothetical protein
MDSETQNTGAKNMTQTSLFSAAPKVNAAAKTAAPKAPAKPAAPSNWKIEIEFSENNEIAELVGRTWDTFESFTAALAPLTLTAPATGCYDKTYTEITHLESGERYDLRLDVTHPDSKDTSDNDLLARVQGMCAYMLKHTDSDAKRAEWAKWAERFETAK